MNNYNSQSRKWFLTLNNPLDKGFTHEDIKMKLSTLKSIVYWCISDEISASGTPHTHMFIQSRSPIRFSTLQNAFDKKADLEHARGTSAQCKEYIEKSGIWADSEKGETSVPGTFEEWGELLQERQGARSDLDDIVDLIENGADNEDIRELYPAQYLLYRDKIERVRQEIKEELYRSEFRKLDITYIFGKSESGKTKYVLELHGYENVCHITNYKNPWDKYRGQDIICLDEYDSQIRLQELNGYLDGYPCTLPCRYADKVACYTKVYIVSNLDLMEQYRNVRMAQPDIWAAFIRRIHRVIHFMPDGDRREYVPRDYLSWAVGWDALPDDTYTPWDDVKGVKND